MVESRVLSTPALYPLAKPSCDGLAEVFRELVMRMNILGHDEKAAPAGQSPWAQWLHPFCLRSNSQSIMEAAAPAPTTSRIPDHPCCYLCQTVLFRGCSRLNEPPARRQRSVWPSSRQTSDSWPSRGMDRLTLSFSLRLPSASSTVNIPEMGKTKVSKLGR